MTAEEEKIIQMICETGRKVVPPGGQVWLYGSRARGDAHEYVSGFVNQQPYIPNYLHFVMA